MSRVFLIKFFKKLLNNFHHTFQQLLPPFSTVINIKNSELNKDIIPHFGILWGNNCDKVILIDLWRLSAPFTYWYSEKKISTKQQKVNRWMTSTASNRAEGETLKHSTPRSPWARRLNKKKNTKPKAEKQKAINTLTNP